MKNRKVILLLLLFVGLGLVPTRVLAEPPPLPSSFYGTLKVDGKNVPLGTTVTAWINGASYGIPSAVTTYQGDTVFSLDVPGDERDTQQIEGGVEGDTIQFRIGNRVADQQGTWQGGTNIELRLSYSTANDQHSVYLPMIKTK